MVVEIHFRQNIHMNYDNHYIFVLSQKKINIYSPTEMFIRSLHMVLINIFWHSHQYGFNIKELETKYQKIYTGLMFLWMFAMKNLLKEWSILFVYKHIYQIKGISMFHFIFMLFWVFIRHYLHLWLKQWNTSCHEFSRLNRELQ